MAHALHSSLDEGQPDRHPEIQTHPSSASGATMRRYGKLFVAVRECCVVSLVSSGFLLLSISSTWTIFLGLTLVSAGFITGATLRA